MTEDLDEQALDFASDYYGIDRSEEGADEHLRRTSAFATKRVNLAAVQLAQVLSVEYRRAFRRFTDWLEQR